MACRETGLYFAPDFPGIFSLSVNSGLRTFQDLILALQHFWADRGCVILQPYDMPMGAGTFHSATFLRAIGPGTVERGLRATQPTTDGWPLWRESEQAAALLPVPGRTQAFPGRDSGPVPRFVARARHRPSRARYPFRRGQLGVPDARCLGPRLGSVAERHGGDAIHLLSAGRRARLPARDRRDHLWPGTHRDVPAGRGERVRPDLDRRRVRTRDIRRCLSPERSRNVTLQLRERGHRGTVRAFRRCGAGLQVPDRAEADAARLTSRCWRLPTASTCSMLGRQSRSANGSAISCGSAKWRGW